MIVQLESKKKELQRKVSQLESEKELAKEHFNKSLKEKIDTIESLTMQIREMEMVDFSRELIEK